MKMKQTGYLFLPTFKKFFPALPFWLPSRSIATCGETTADEPKARSVWDGGETELHSRAEAGEPQGGGLALTLQQLPP